MTGHNSHCFCEMSLQKLQCNEIKQKHQIAQITFHKSKKCTLNAVCTHEVFVSPMLHVSINFVVVTSL